jgi:uncharacterized integral membrane protein
MKDFLFTLLCWLVTLPFLIGAIVFALYNKEPVALTLNPFSSSMEISLYVPVLCALALGFVFGAVMTWAAMGRLRHERRQQAKRIRALEEQVKEADQAQSPLLASSANPALRLLGRS